MRHRASLFPLVLVAALAALSFWLQRITEPAAADRSGRFRHDPDFIVDTFTVRRFDAAGVLQHTLTAKQMQHYPDDDTTTVQTPEVVFHTTPPTNLSAETAWVAKDAKSVRLERKVRLRRSAADGGFPTEVDTEVLDVFPEEETARTNAPVTITQGPTIIKGTGLLLDNKKAQTTLLGPVRGTIHRNPGTKP